MTKRAASLPENSTTIVSVPLPSGNAVRFYDRAIVVFDRGHIAVFSSKCPHLGCRINSVESSAQGRELVCPCHGSRYSLSGQLVHGPATRGLEPLAFNIDRADAVLRIAVKS